MTNFPISLLQPMSGLVGPHPIEGIFIRIELQPFIWNSTNISTALRWDFVNFAGDCLASLAETTSTFGRAEIDASIYIDHAHHPIDVNSVSFGPIYENKVEAQFDMTIDFAHEGLGDYGPTQWSFTCPLKWTNMPQPA